MFIWSNLWVFLLALSELVFCTGVEENELSAGVISFPLSKAKLQDRIDLWKRQDDTVSVQLKNQVSMFSATLNIGSNDQKVTVLVDTGSSDLWVMSNSNPECDESSFTSPWNGGGTRCFSHTKFDPSKSDTFSLNDTLFTISYGDGSYARGNYCQDKVSYGSAEIKHANFAIANESSSGMSVWGIGFRGLESTARFYNEQGEFFPTYSNLPVQMKESGLIQQNAYSIWLNNIDASSGTLLFGGVDHSRYEGTLQTLPILRSYSRAMPNQMLVKLDEISIYQGSKREKIIECAYPALLDSGTTYMMLPNEFIEVIIQSVGGSYGSRGECLVACGIKGGLSFDFSGVTIDVPFSQMEFPLTNREDVCLLGMLPNGERLILGDTFLRSAYVVYDLEKFEIGLAPYNSKDSKPSIEAIVSGIPQATKAPRYSSTETHSSISTNIATFVNGQAPPGILGLFSTQPFPTRVSESNIISKSYSMMNTARETPPYGNHSESHRGRKNNKKNDANSLRFGSVSGILASSFTFILVLFHYL